MTTPRLALLALPLLLAACPTKDAEDDADTDTDATDTDTDATDTDDGADTDTDEDAAPDAAEVRFVLGYLNQDITDVTLTLDGDDVLADLTDELDGHEGYFFTHGRQDAGLGISEGSHEVDWSYTFNRFVCMDPPDCTMVEQLSESVSGTVTFDAAEGDSWVVAAILSFAFTGQEIVPESFSWAESVAPPTEENRGILVMQGGSSGVNGPMDVRVIGEGPTGPTYVERRYGFEAREVHPVPFAGPLEIALAQVNTSNFTYYDHGSLADGEVTHMVVRAVNQAPFVPKPTGAGAARLLEIER